MTKKLMLYFLLLTCVMSVTGIAAAQQNWVLVKTAVNPNNDLLEYYGGGTTPNYYTDERYKDKFQIYTVSSTSFSVQDKEVDRDFVYHDVVLTTNFSSPPGTLTPGERVNLSAGFYSSGSVNSGSPGRTFWYTGDGISISPTDAFGYYPWSPQYTGISSTTYSFVVPNIHTGEIKLYASWWNSPGTLVEWTYQVMDEDQSECTVDIRGIDISGTLAVGEQITFAVEAENDCNRQIYYRFSYHPYYGTSGYDGTQWASLTDTEWITTDSCTYSFTEAGDYIVVIWAVDDSSDIPDAIPIIGSSVTIKETRP